jgi:hypothetical protein
LRQALLFWKYTPTNPIFRACLKQEREIVPKGLFRLTPPKNSFSSGSGEILWDGLRSKVKAFSKKIEYEMVPPHRQNIGY